jgi:hypothetical protein
MGLASVVKNAVSAGFNAMGASTDDGLQTAMTYNRVVVGEYSTTTGKRVTTVSATPLDAIFYKVRDKEVDGIKIKINDVRIVFPQSKLLFTPSANDYITLSGRKMEVIQIIEDPARATWLLFVRGV